MANKAKHFWIEPDELSRKGLDFCSLAAQGLWLKVMRLMHDSERYGYLSRDGKAISDEQLARRCGVDLQTWLTLAGELTDFDLLKRTADGILFSPELVAQEEWRSKEAKRKKDQRNRGREMSQECPAESPAQCPEDVPDKSDANSKLLNSQEEEKEEKGGGGSHSARAPARKSEQPPPPPKFETLPEYLLRKQVEFPHLDVQKIHDDFKSKCGSEKYPKLKNTREHFDKWLAEQHIEFKDEEQKSARQLAIENCVLCNENGMRKIDGKFKDCKHNG